MIFTILFLATLALIIVRAVNKTLNKPHDSTLPDRDGANKDLYDSADSDDSYDPSSSADSADSTVPAVRNEQKPLSEEETTAATLRPVPDKFEPKRSGLKKTAPKDTFKPAAYDRMFGLIGKPLGHSESKALFNKRFGEQHISAYYENFELDDLSQLDGLIANNPKLCGFSVTIPYKQDIIPLLDSVDETARIIGAVNAVKVIRKDEKTKLIGYNTDWIGFTRSIETLAEGHKKALILGSGGVSKAVKYALDWMMIESSFVSRKPTFDMLRYYELSSSIIEDHTLIVNCTPVGMWPDVDKCPDFPYAFLTKQHLLYDVIANPAETLFMKKGIQRGATVKGGGDMLRLQADAAWEIWNKPD